jgi:hypothetical protein
MVLLALYSFFLFIFGLGTAVVTYHILRYRDPDDISGVVLAIYYIIVFIIVIGTALLVDWPQLFSTTSGLF